MVSISNISISNGDQDTVIDKRDKITTPNQQKRKRKEASDEEMTDIIHDKKRQALARSWGFSNWDKKTFNRVVNPLATESTVIQYASPSPVKQLELTPGNWISYCMLELGEDNTPRMSNPIEAAIIQVDQTKGKRSTITLQHEDEEPSEMYLTDVKNIKILK
jgi:hypothetical protein